MIDLVVYLLISIGGKHWHWMEPLLVVSSGHWIIHVHSGLSCNQFMITAKSWAGRNFARSKLITRRAWRFGYREAPGSKFGRQRLGSALTKTFCPFWIRNTWKGKLTQQQSARNYRDDHTLSTMWHLFSVGLQLYILWILAISRLHEFSTGKFYHLRIFHSCEFTLPIAPLNFSRTFPGFAFLEICVSIGSSYPHWSPIRFALQRYPFNFHESIIIHVAALRIIWYLLPFQLMFFECRQRWRRRARRRLVGACCAKAGPGT